MQVSGCELRQLPAWVLALVAVQIVVPLVALVGSPAPSRFGFQMYSAVGSVEAQVLDSEGEVLRVDADLIAGTVRPDLTWVDRLPEYLCDQIPRAATVRVAQGDEERSVRCAGR